VNLNHVPMLLAAVMLVGTVQAQAGEHRHQAGSRERDRSVMKAVAVAAEPGQPGHGWRYFTDARQRRAVVISPAGDYYLSRGTGLELVFKGHGAA
jgi:hypothetical protein